MTKNISAFLIGILFSIGLGISGMTNPQKVIGFLNIFNDWDPSLMFVMIGAISVHFVAFRLITQKQSPILANEFQIPQKTEISKSLIFGSALFGAGWGMAGYCPGPAITSLAGFHPQPFIFVASMICGMSVVKLLK